MKKPAVALELLWRGEDLAKKKGAIIVMEKAEGRRVH